MAHRLLLSIMLPIILVLLALGLWVTSVPPPVDAQGQDHLVFLPIILRSAPVPPRYDMIPIPAGPFQMGCGTVSDHPELCFTHELPLHTVTLAAYAIDKYEVTNAQAADCVADGGCSPLVESISATRDSYSENKHSANQA